MTSEQLTESQAPPFFSIVIPSYNNAGYLRKCILSLQKQNFSEWEAVIVIDASPDNAFYVASELSEVDKRIKVINKEKNEGTHLARKSGVARARGQYTLFLDADDELTDNALSSLADLASLYSFDILHFGTELFGEEMPASTCSDILQLSNRDLPTLHKSEIAFSSFTSRENPRQDWRILQRLYRTDLLKRAFSLMTGSRLGRGQDSYEWLVIASLANTEIFHNEMIGYRYYLGRGITTFKPMSKQQFAALSTNYANLIRVAFDYASKFSTFDLMPCVHELHRRLLEMLFGDWYVRLSDKDKLTTLTDLRDSFTREDIATELMRLTRDDAYSHWDAGDVFDVNARYVQWKQIAEELMGASSNKQYELYRSQVLRHFLDLQTRNSMANRTIRPSSRNLLSIFHPFMPLFRSIKRKNK